MNIDLNKILADVKPQAPAKRAYKPQRYELNFQTDGMAPCVDEAHKAAQWWINDIANEENGRRRWLTLFGRSGCGKTHLMTAAYEHVKRYFIVREKLAVPERFAEAYNPNVSNRVQMRKWNSLFATLMKPEHEKLLYDLQKVDVLLLDDIGSELTESTRAQSASSKLLYDLLDARLKKWTFLTSNLAPDQLPDSRIASRLFRGENVIIDMRDAKDYSFESYKRSHDHQK